MTGESAGVWADVPHRVLLLNFGGPETAADVEPFLRKLFEDPFIIRAPLGPMRGLLARRIAAKRAPKSTREYEKIGFSSINRLTRLHAERLEQRLRRRHADTKVLVANRYTPPFAEYVIAELDPERQRVFFLSLYPHLSHTTTVSAFRDVDLAFRARHGTDHPFPSIRIFSWWNDPDYLTYTAHLLLRQLEEVLKHESSRIAIVFSAHGIPRKYHDRGDPYVMETWAHFKELKRRGERWLAANAPSVKVEWHLSFQSRVGPVEWVKPYTDELVAGLGKDGGSLLMVPISFTSDHIETLFEMDVTYRELALTSGFRFYDRVPAPNDDEAFTDCLEAILTRAGFPG